MRGRYRRIFTVYCRKLKSGKKVQYIRIYSDDGSTRIAFSSGLRSKEAAFTKYSKILSDPDVMKQIQTKYEIHKSEDIKKKKITTIRSAAPILSGATHFDEYAKY